MHEAALIRDLAVVMIVSGITTVVFRWLKQPVVLGYLLAGLLIGPHTPPFPLIEDRASIDTLAQLGIIFLMFSLGLEFNLRKLTQVGAPAIIAAISEILLLFWAGYVIGRLFGWATMNCIFLGAMLSMSSTTVIIKVLSELGKIKERFAHLIFGILIIEDILGIAMIALLSGMAMTGGLSVGDVGRTLGKLAVFLVVVLVAGLIVVPRLIGRVARFKSDEMLIITVLGLCFGVSLLAMNLNYSVALGAFVIGAIIAEARQIHKIVTLIEPIRDMFSAVFFVTIGMLIEPQMLVQYALPIAVITLVVIAGKIITCSCAVFSTGVDARTSLRVGMGLAQIGEFSFIIAALGQTLNVTDKFLYPIAVAVSSVTTLLTPYLIRCSDTVVTTLGRIAPQSAATTLRLYTSWFTNLRNASPRHPGLRFVRSLIWQLVLNIALIIAAFVFSAFAARVLPDYIPILAKHPIRSRALCWVGAALLTLPIYVATVRKLQALSMMLSEISITSGQNDRTPILRRVMSAMIFTASLLGIGLITLVLSSAILPSGILLAALFVGMIIAALIFGTYFNRLYSRAKFALVETWSQPPPVVHAPAPALPPMLDAAELELFEVVKGPLAGKYIRELNLRARAGVSIVAIDRAGKRTINPGPDEDLQPGDKILLFGEPAQIARALQLLHSITP